MHFEFRLLIAGMENINNSVSLDLGIEEVITRLSTNKTVAGILQIGSLRKGQLTPASDYDLVIILDKAPKHWFVGVTQIDQRFTDLIFVSRLAVQTLLELDGPIEHEDDIAPIIRWFHDGEFLYDRDGLVKAAQEKVKRGDWIKPLPADAVYGAWFQINYDLAQLKRMILSEDPLYQQVVDIRMAVYGTSDLWFGYFTLRKIEWFGDKAAIRYLSEHDPEFLRVFQQFINCPQNRVAKIKAYEKAAYLAAAPLGGIWPEDTTVVNLEETSGIWQRLLGER